MDATGNGKKVTVAMELQIADGIEDVILELDTLESMGVRASSGGHQVLLTAPDA